MYATTITPLASEYWLFIDSDLTRGQIRVAKINRGSADGSRVIAEALAYLFKIAEHPGPRATYH